MYEAYHGSTGVKEFALTRVREHREAKHFIRRRTTDWEPVVPGENGFRGCAIGCLANPVQMTHPSQTVPVMSIKSQLLYEFGFFDGFADILDTIFEMLPAEQAPDWVHEAVDAIPVGLDTETWAKAFWKECKPLQHIGALRFHNPIMDEDAYDAQENAEIELCEELGLDTIEAGDIDTVYRWETKTAHRWAREARAAFLAAFDYPPMPKWEESSEGLDRVHA